MGILMRLGALLAAVGAVVVVAVAGLLVLTTRPSGTAWVDLRVGDCFDLASALSDTEVDDPLYRVDVVPCADEHDAEVVATGELNPEGGVALPPDDELFELVDRRCLADVGDRLDRARFALVPIAPDERTWRGREGRYACVAVVVGGGTVTGSATDDRPA